TTVHSMVDFFLLLMLPGAGDELQGIKRGVMEMADLIAINKTEKESLKQAKRAKKDYENALALFPPAESGWSPKVTTCSALHQTGIEEIWNEVESYLKQTRDNSFFERRRKEQAAYWMYETIQQELKRSFYSNPNVNKHLQKIEESV